MLVDKKTSVTLVQLAGWGTMLFSGAVSLSATYFALTSRQDNTDNKVEKLTEYVERLDRRGLERIQISDRNNSDFRAALAILPLMQEKLEQLSIANTSTMSKVAETNTRMDRVVDSFNGKLDTSNEKTTNILVQIGVLGAKLDRVLTQEGERPKPAILRRFSP